MARVVLLAGVFLGVAGVFAPRVLYSQSAADSLAIMQVLGENLREAAIVGVANRFGCYHAPACAPEELTSKSAVRLLGVLAAAAHVPLSAPPPFARVPHCPPPERIGSEAPGYFFHVGIPQIEGDRAVVAVARACEWSPAARDRILGIGEEYILEKGDGAWIVTHRRFTWRS